MLKLGTKAKKNLQNKAGDSFFGFHVFMLHDYLFHLN